MYVRAKIELIADNDAGTFSADSGEWMIQYPLPTSIVRAIGKWLLARTDAIEGPELELPDAYVIPYEGSFHMATGSVDPKANKP